MRLGRKGGGSLSAAPLRVEKSANRLQKNKKKYLKKKEAVGHVPVLGTEHRRPLVSAVLSVLIVLYRTAAP